MDSNIERWYSMKEICEYLGVSRDTVLDWIERRNMPAAKIGRLWKFKVSEATGCNSKRYCRIIGHTDFWILICSGKTKIEKCSAETVYKLAKTLGVSMEMLTESGIRTTERERLFEHGLPDYLQHDLDAMLGTFIVNGKEKIVCACLDFTEDGKKFYDFCSIKNTVLDSDSNGKRSFISDILLQDGI